MHLSRMILFAVSSLLLSVANLYSEDPARPPADSQFDDAIAWDKVLMIRMPPKTKAVLEVHFPKNDNKWESCLCIYQTDGKISTSKRIGNFHSDDRSKSIGLNNNTDQSGNLFVGVWSKKAPKNPALTWHILDINGGTRNYRDNDKTCNYEYYITDPRSADSINTSTIKWMKVMVDVKFFKLDTNELLVQQRLASGVPYFGVNRRDP